MQVNEEKEVTIEEFFDLCAKGGTYLIDTPFGWKGIPHLIKKQNKKCYNIVLQNGLKLGCSEDHYVLAFQGDQCNWVCAKDLDVNDLVCLRRGYSYLASKELLGTRDTFDLEVDDKAHCYFSNDIISHNTGKSMICDALASEYKMPLLRLDFGAVFSAHVGESEANIRECLQTAEAIAPAILWLDEVEKGIGGVESSNATDGGVTNRVFGTMLTWMQDKLAPVFMVCTANNIAGLPPEFMRAGRFDEIFFIDLPNEEQRAEVTEKLLSRKKRDPSQFDIDQIVSATHNYTPVEIEKGIDNALFVAYSDNKRALTTKDIVVESGKFFPLYNSRREEIEAMREWALGEEGTGGRAVLANSPVKPVVDNGESHRALDIGTSLDIDTEL